MLKREDIEINHKRAYRLYKEAGLSLKRKTKRCSYEKRGMPDRTNVLYNGSLADYKKSRKRGSLGQKQMKSPHQPQEQRAQQKNMQTRLITVMVKECEIAALYAI